MQPKHCDYYAVTEDTLRQHADCNEKLRSEAENLRREKAAADAVSCTGADQEGTIARLKERLREAGNIMHHDQMATKSLQENFKKTEQLIKECHNIHVDHVQATENDRNDTRNKMVSVEKELSDTKCA